MSSNYTTDQETDGSITDQLASKTVPVPITVPEPVEQEARERLEEARENGRAPDFDNERDQLDAFLLDYLQPDPEFLTRDVVHEDYDEPLTHAVYTCLTEEDYEEAVAVADAAEDIGSVQEFVREAVRSSLSGDSR